MSRKAIDDGHQRFLAALEANDAELLMGELTDDARFMPPDRPRLKGKAAIRGWYEALVTEAPTVKIQVPEREVDIAGDWAVETGTFIWTLAPAASDATVETSGDFVAIWRLLEDGSWKISLDIWNSSDPGIV